MTTSKLKPKKKSSLAAGDDSEDEDFEDKDGNSDSNSPMDAIIKDINCTPGSASGNWWMDKEIERDIRDIVKQFKKK